MPEAETGRREPWGMLGSKPLASPASFGYLSSWETSVWAPRSLPGDLLPEFLPTQCVRPTPCILPPHPKLHTA